MSEPESSEVLDSSDEVARPVLDGLTAFGRLLGRAACQVGATIADAYMALDPDLKRHLAQMPLVGLTMLAPGRPKVEARGEGDATAVLFVHGLGGHRGNFIPMLGYFWWEGSNRTYAVGFEQPASLEAMAEELRNLIAEVTQVNGLSGERTVDLVAHSMGGLVCRIALEDEPTRARIRKLVTLGTPHTGTHAARFLATQSALALRPDSNLLERLDAQLPWPDGPTWPEATTYWSRADIVLLPPEAARLEGAHSPELETMTHYGYLLHPTGWRAVYETLYGTVTSPGVLETS